MKLKPFGAYFTSGLVHIVSECEYRSGLVEEAYDKPKDVTVINWNGGIPEELETDSQVIYVHKDKDCKVDCRIEEMGSNLDMIEIHFSELSYDSTSIRLRLVQEELLIELATLLPEDNLVRIKVKDIIGE